MGYLEQVKVAVLNWMDENEDWCGEYKDDDTFAERLDDILWSDDSVTGNGSGSYTFNRAKAREYVLEDFDTVVEALNEFCTPNDEIVKHFIEEDWEWFDVTARCYILRRAIEDALEETADE